MPTYVIHDIAGAIASPECRKLAALASGKLVLEIGSQHGSSTVSMAQTARLVVAFDWHRGDEHSKFQDTLAGFRGNLLKYNVMDKVIPIVANIEEGARLLRPGMFDFAFVDARHYYADTRRHILLAAELLKPDGVIAVHDYGWSGFPGVKQAVDELVGDRLTEVLETLAIFSVTAIHVPASGA